MLLRLLRAQLKQAAKSAPRMILTFALLILICGGFAYAAARYLYSEENGKISIALYYPEEEASSLMIAAIEKMDSAKQNLEIIRADEEDVRPMVESGEVYGGIIIPKDFVKDIITGKNTPATVYLPKSASSDSLLVRSYLNAGIGDLAAAQAGIYALLDCFGYGSDTTDLVNINLTYLNAAFTREELFKDITVSAVGSISLLQYYAISAFIIFMLLFGCVFSRVGLSLDGAVGSRLKIYGISSFKLWLSEFIVTFILYAVTAGILIGGVYLLPEGLGLKPTFGVIPLISLLSLVLFCSLFVSAAFCVFDFGGSVIIFIFTLVCSLLSGAILPVSFLPQKIQGTAEAMPVRILADALASAYNPSVTATGLIVPLVAFVVIAIILFVKDRLN